MKKKEALKEVYEISRKWCLEGIKLNEENKMKKLIKKMKKTKLYRSLHDGSCNKK